MRARVNWIMATKPTDALETRRAAADAARRPTTSRRFRFRMIWFAGLALIGLAGGYWAYGLLTWSAADSDMLWAQAEADYLAGRYDRVGDALKRLGRLRVPTPLDHLLRAQYAAVHHAPDKALAELKRVPDDHPMAAQARLLAGQIELRRDRLRTAEAWFQAAIKLDPKLIQAHRELIYIYGMQLRRPELNARFLTLSGLTPLSADNVFHWCMLRNNSWEPGEAVDSLTRYVSADPRDRWSRLALAENYRRMGEREKAEPVLAALEALDTAAVAIRAQIAIDGLEQERAERLLAAVPGDAAALATLRGKLALAKRDAQGAWHHFRVAFQSDPDDRETVFGLVRALELAGQSKAAAPFRELAGRLERLNTLIQRAATPKAREDTALLRELGAACAALKALPGSRAWYELAIAMDSADSESQRAALSTARSGASEPC